MCFVVFLQNDPQELMDETTYVFGSPLGAVGPFAPVLNFTRKDITLSEQIIEYWTNFVKYG